MLEKIQGLVMVEEKKTLHDLILIAERLRVPEGCPWDREQTLESLRAYVLEEAYEVIQAIELEDTEGLVEELGDFLFQVVFISQIASEEGKFNIDDVIRGICDKLVSRHPHVFGEKKAKDTEEALETWNAEKMKEKRGKLPVEEVPRTMPSLMRAQRIGEKASRAGFDWESASCVLSEVKEELWELEKEMGAGEPEKIKEEWGDLVFPWLIRRAVWKAHQKVFTVQNACWRPEDSAESSATNCAEHQI